MKTVWILMLTIVVSMTSLHAQHYYVEASRSAIVRTQPDRNAEMILRMTQGDQLNLVRLEQTDTYYEVVLPAGGSGWVSRYVVRVHEGEAPHPLGASSSTEVASGPVADVTSLGEPVAYQVLRRRAYSAGYDPRLKIPVWVQYTLTKAHSEADDVDRSNAFGDDEDIHEDGRAYNVDYDQLGDGYVKGHMAPADDFRWSAEAERETNLLTNIAPQIGSAYNGSVWKRIENSVRDWAESRGEITVITGPVFFSRDSIVTKPDSLTQPGTARQVVYNVLGEHEVAVPTGFYKIIVDATGTRPEVIAFLVPHYETHTDAERSIARYIVSVDEIERVTGIDFLPELENGVEAEIESQRAPGLW
ncbi:DNA/RNA non-specific endonuclease [bacterium]|nr:DNA/RNA non-specific endonuclease [bacterium]